MTFWSKSQINRALAAARENNLAPAAQPEPAPPRRTEPRPRRAPSPRAPPVPAPAVPAPPGPPSRPRRRKIRSPASALAGSCSKGRSRVKSGQFGRKRVRLTPGGAGAGSVTASGRRLRMSPLRGPVPRRPRRKLRNPPPILSRASLSRVRCRPDPPMPSPITPMAATGGQGDCEPSPGQTYSRRLRRSPSPTAAAPSPMHPAASGPLPVRRRPRPLLQKSRKRIRRAQRPLPPRSHPA